MGEKGANSTMKFIELSQAQKMLVFTQASAQRGINVNLAEKDWYAVLTSSLKESNFVIAL